jgi:hypothetical protein
VPRKPPPQLGLFDQTDAGLARLANLEWPKAQRFPLNLSEKINVGVQVNEDLLSSTEPLVITGYASLDHIIQLVTQLTPTSPTIRLLFGSEPFPSRQDQFSLDGAVFPAEVERYWLARGISLLLSGKIVRARTLLKEGRVLARYLGTSRVRLHAKMYCGDHAITLGSSNYTEPGLKRQIEANVRFTQTGDKRRFTDAKKIAENLWAKGDDYGDELDALLEKLLKSVTWEEALARGCAELPEGDWAQDRLRQQLLPYDQPLWPSQVQGIAQSLWLIETVGSVLIADATGSGKTRMGAHLLRSMVDRIWGSGRIRKGRPVMICPPAVESMWEHEATLCGLTLDTRSHGLLSHPSASHPQVREALRRAQILAVDEAHNFLNPRSDRTRMLLGNMADHTVLFTATPINKGVVDLLRLADVLGADNLDDSTLEMFDALLRRRFTRGLTEHQFDALRREIQRFTVRRTKARLNEMVDTNPDAYRDESGQQCRYPEHRSSIYPLSESDADRRIATEIRAETEKLVGVALMSKRIEMPDVLIREGWTEEKYLRSRLLAAKKLAAYLIMATLRSSRAALLEHLTGTEAALAESGLSPNAKRQPTGNQIAKLEKMAERPPGSALTVEVPAWLVDAAEHKFAAEADASCYSRIQELAELLSTEREVTKGQNLLNLLEQHHLVVAFDSRPITLAFLERMLSKNLGSDKVILATGESASGKERARKALAPGSTQKGVVALCSDAMAEGLNLQQASAILHLDMPSVVRVAEQRVGRVDRMDSPHDTIEAWWPDDAEEFALRSDERFVERYETVDSLIGSNMPLPPELSGTAGRALRAVELVDEYQQRERDGSWDGLQDAFAPVRMLVEGTSALVPQSTYEHYRHTQARIVARVSVVSAVEPWAFFCVAGTNIGAPHWVLVDGRRKEPLTQLTEIAGQLRAKLDSATEDLPFDDRAASRLEDMLARLANAERALLPRKKQRALEEMELVLRRYSETALAEKHLDVYERLRRTLNVFKDEYQGRGVDWDAMAEKWLDLIRPAWYARLLGRRRLRPLRLKDIRSDLLNGKRLDFDTVTRELEQIDALPPLHERVVSCILGMNS